MPILLGANTTATLIICLVSYSFSGLKVLPALVLTIHIIFQCVPLVLEGCYLYFSPMRKGEGRGWRQARAPSLCMALPLCQLRAANRLQKESGRGKSCVTRDLGGEEGPSTSGNTLLTSFPVTDARTWYLS